MLAKSNGWLLNYDVSMDACGTQEETTSKIYLVNSLCAKGIIAFSCTLWSIGNETFNKMIHCFKA